MTYGFKTLLMLGGGALLAIAGYLHFVAPQHMHALGRALHGGQ